MRHRKTVIITLGLLVLLAVPAAAEPAAEESPSWPMTVTDDLGRTVTLESPPKRVVPTVTFAFDLLRALEVTPVLRPDIPEEYLASEEDEEIPVIEMSHEAGPNLEQLAASAPDLVLTAPTFAQFADDMETVLGVPVLVLDIRSVDEVEAKFQWLGRILNRPKQAKKAMARFREEVETAAEGAPDEGARVFAMFGNPQSWYGFLPESYLGDLLAHLQGDLVTEGGEPLEAHRTLSPFSLERVLAADPDVILVVQHGATGEALTSLRDNPAWQGLRAVKEGRVYSISQWLFVMAPGPRAPEALRQLADILYPKGDHERS